ncbi:MAG TPA: hypothetical protein VE268_11495 [Herpetosiphonaceae bacterium]|nr:hypothetical protein [Herpetosiphonaceae bacterium]
MSTKPDLQPGYASYLLRLWPVRSGGRVVWRASLESTRTADQHRFATLDQLMIFLREQTSSADSVCLEISATDGRRRQSRAAWRFSVEDAHSGEQHEFTSLEALLAFLHSDEQATELRG